MNRSILVALALLLLGIAMVVAGGCSNKLENDVSRRVGQGLEVVAQGAVISDVARYDYFVVQDDEENRYLVVPQTGIVRMGK